MPSRLLFGRFFFCLSFDSIVASSLLKKVRYYLLLTLHQCTVFPNILCHIISVLHNTKIHILYFTCIDKLGKLVSKYEGANFFPCIFPYNFWKKINKWQHCCWKSTTLQFQLYYEEEEEMQQKRTFWTHIYILTHTHSLKSFINFSQLNILEL